MQTKSKALIGLAFLAAAGGAGYYFLVYKKKMQPVVTTPQTPMDIITAGVSSGAGFYQGSEFISAEDFNHLMQTFGRTFADQAAIYINRGSISAYGGMQGLVTTSVSSQQLPVSASAGVIQSPEVGTLLMRRLRAIKG